MTRAVQVEINQARLIYLQLQKTGCTQIASVLAENISGEQVGKHNFLREYVTDKKIIGSVRNPWTWYISLWAYGCEGKGTFYHLVTKKKLIELARKMYHREIKESIYEVIKPTRDWVESYADSDDPECFKKWLRNMYNPSKKMDLGEEYHKYDLSSFAGFYTHRYCRLHLRDYYKGKTRKMVSSYEDLIEYDEKNNLLDYCIRMESLEEDLINALKLSGYTSLELQDRIIKSREKRRNTSRHKEAGYYYDKETIQLVAEKERFIIEKYGYVAPKIN